MQDLILDDISTVFAGDDFFQEDITWKQRLNPLGTGDATYNLITGLGGIFENPANMQIIGRVLQDYHEPLVHMAYAAVSGLDKRYDLLTIRGTDYKVVEIKDDGTGMCEVQVAATKR